MPKITDLVSTLGSGWKTVGTGTPVEEVQTIPNPMASNPVAPAGTPSTITQGTGRYYVVVQDPEGHQRAMFLSPSSDQGVSGPGLTPTPSVTGKADGSKENPAAPGTRIVAPGELANLNWEQAGAIADVPAGPTTKQPSPTDKLDQVTDPATGKVIALRDPATGTNIPVPAGAQPVLHDVGDQVWSVKADGTYTVVGAKPKEPTQLNVPGVGLVEYDPKGTDDATKYHVVMPTPTDVNNLGGIQTRNGKSYYPVKNPDGSIQWVETNLPAEVKVTGTYDSPDSPYVIFTDQAGKEISRLEKPGWKPPIRVQPGTAPAADSTNPFIITLDPTTGAPVSTPNTNQIKSSQATEELAKQLGVKVAAGSMSEDQAQKIITGAINTMNAQTNRQNADINAQQAATAKDTQIATAAGDVLRQTGTNAQTGAGLLQNRVTTATGALTSLVGSAAGSKMTSIPGGVGEGLVNGLQDWVTGLGGGKDVYDTAARMVQAADPKISQDPTLANQAQQTLGNMLALYQKQNGDQPHPLVAATQAANQSVQNGGGVTAPVTTPDTTSGLQQGQQTNVSVNQALQQQQQANALRARGLQNTPQGAAIAAGQTPVATNPPVYPGQYNTAWQQGFISPVGTISTGPNAANGFVAPLIPV